MQLIMILNQKLLNQQKPPTNFTRYFTQFYMMNDECLLSSVRQHLKHQNINVICSLLSPNNRLYTAQRGRTSTTLY